MRHYFKNEAEYRNMKKVLPVTFHSGSDIEIHHSPGGSHSNFGGRRKSAARRKSSVVTGADGGGSKNAKSRGGKGGAADTGAAATSTVSIGSPKASPMRIVIGDREKRTSGNKSITTSSALITVVEED